MYVGVPVIVIFDADVFDRGNDVDEVVIHVVDQVQINSHQLEVAALLRLFGF